MENLVVVAQILHRPIGQHLAHSGHEAVPVGGAVEIIHHEEAALEQVFAQPLRLRIGERPVCHLHGIDPRVVEDLVAVEIDDLLDGAHLDAGEALQRQQELAIRLGIVARPTGPVAVSIAVSEAEAAATAPARRYSAAATSRTPPSRTAGIRDSASCE